MADNRMTYQIDSNMQFPLVEIDLEAGDSIFLQKEVWYTTHRRLPCKQV